MGNGISDRVLAPIGREGAERSTVILGSSPLAPQKHTVVVLSLCFFLKLVATSQCQFHCPILLPRPSSRFGFLEIT